MAVKKIINSGALEKDRGVERSARDTKSGAAKVLMSPKDPNRRTKVSHAENNSEVIALTEADLARIDEICARDIVMTEHVRAAILKPWKAVRT
jgi:hypothetical protein